MKWFKDWFAFFLYLQFLPKYSELILNAFMVKKLLKRAVFHKKCDFLLIRFFEHKTGFFEFVAN